MVESGPKATQRRVGHSDFWPRYGVLVVFAAQIVLFAVLAPDTFATTANFSSIVNSQSALLVLALAIVPTLAAGEYDLSAASTMALTATIAGQLSTVQQQPLWLALTVAMAAAVLVGLVNATLAVAVGVQSIVVTLGMGTLLIGMAVWISDSMTIAGVPDELSTAMNSKLAGISAAFYYALLVGLVLWYLYRHTPVGRYVLFIGQNREVARLSGVPVGRVRTGTFVATSVLAGIAGIMTLGIAGGLQPTSLQSLLLPAFAAASRAPRSSNPAGLTRSARSSPCSSWLPASPAWYSSASTPGYEMSFTAPRSFWP